jgi:hypothetical protein
MTYYELRKLKRGHAPLAHRPDIRPASSSHPESGSELFEAKDDDEAAERGRLDQLQLGSEFIVSVYDNAEGTRRMVYPRKNDDA